MIQCPHPVARDIGWVDCNNTTPPADTPLSRGCCRRVRRLEPSPMISTSLIPWLDPETIISGAGPWALVVVCAIVFAETGLLVGFLLPGDTLLIISGLLTHTVLVFGVDIWWVCLAIGFAAFLGGEVGYLI